MLGFSVLRRDGASAARRGRLSLDHGIVETPAFMPVGTAGTVKAVRWEDVAKAGAEIVLANTYHLMLRPGGDAVRRLGGLHRFTGWTRPILTDSGGYQVMSLAANRTLSDEGVVFRSHLDGTELLLTPERAMELQARDFGADVAMALDECPPHGVSREEARASMERTHRWAARSLARFREIAGDGGRGALFGIVQGGMHADLRTESASTLSSMAFEGLACGGVSVGEPKEETRRIVAFTGPRLPEAKPRYLMGVGRPDDLVHAVAHGFDLFDCVLPTRAARHGLLFTSEGTLTIKQARWREDPRPPDPSCACPTCRSSSRAYLRHLFVAGEPTAATLLTVHNLTSILDLMCRIRDALEENTFGSFAAETAERFRTDDRKDAR